MERAESMAERGDPLRTALILSEGLRRDPGNVDAVDWLLNLYVNEVPRPGMEREVLRVLELQPDGFDLYEVVEARLSEMGQEEKLVRLRRVRTRNQLLPGLPMTWEQVEPPRAAAAPGGSFAVEEPSLCSSAAHAWDPATEIEDEAHLSVISNPIFPPRAAQPVAACESAVQNTGDATPPLSALAAELPEDQPGEQWSQFESPFDANSDLEAQIEEDVSTSGVWGVVPEPTREPRVNLSALKSPWISRALGAVAVALLALVAINLFAASRSGAGDESAASAQPAEDALAMVEVVEERTPAPAEAVQVRDEPEGILHLNID